MIIPPGLVPGDSGKPELQTTKAREMKKKIEAVCSTGAAC
jgi:hypothetical protein